MFDSTKGYLKLITIKLTIRCYSTLRVLPFYLRVQEKNQTSLFSKLLVFLRDTSFESASSNGTILSLPLVPTSSRLRTFTALASSSSWPTTTNNVYQLSAATKKAVKHGTHTKNKVVLRDLSISNFLGEGVLTVIYVGMQAKGG